MSAIPFHPPENPLDSLQHAASCMFLVALVVAPRVLSFQVLNKFWKLSADPFHSLWSRWPKHETSIISMLCRVWFWSERVSRDFIDVCVFFATVCSDLFEYDPTTASWSSIYVPQGDDLSIGRTMHGFSSANCKLYVSGGYAVIAQVASQGSNVHHPPNTLSTNAHYSSPTLSLCFSLPPSLSLSLSLSLRASLSLFPPSYPFIRVLIHLSISLLIPKCCKFCYVYLVVCTPDS